MYRQSDKFIKQQYLLHISHNMVNFGPLTAEIGWRVWDSHQISTGFASRLRYCTNVAQRRSTKLCTLGRLLGWYTICIHFGEGGSWNFVTCKIHFASKSCVLLYWQRYCTALEQCASAKLCGVVQGMELRNFCSSPFSLPSQSPGISPAGKFTKSGKTNTNTIDYIAF